MRGTKNVCVVYNHPGSWINNDLDLLRRHFNVTEYNYNRDRKSIKGKYLKNLIKNSDVLFLWFASHHGLKTVKYAKRYNKKIITVSGGYDVSTIKGYGLASSVKTRWIPKYILKNSDVILAFSNSAKREIENIVNDKNIIVSFGIDTDNFYPSGKKEDIVLTVAYRESYNLFCCNIVSFNHESKRRGLEFVTRKITHSAAKIKLGLQEKLVLGNLNAKRDWGYAPDYCIDYDVPVLTPTGWKYRKDLSIGDKVINFNSESNSTVIDSINDIYDTKSDGTRYHFTGRGVDFKCTENHRIYYQKKSKTSKGGWSNWKIASAKEVYGFFEKISHQTKYDYRFPGFSNNDIQDYEISDDKLYLIGALLAEGCLATSNRRMEISLSQSRIANEKVHSKIESILPVFLMLSGNNLY